MTYDVSIKLGVVHLVKRESNKSSVIVIVRQGYGYNNIVLIVYDLRQF